MTILSFLINKNKNKIKIAWFVCYNNKFGTDTSSSVGIKWVPSELLF